jgi:hypothetical protein
MLIDSQYWECKVSKLIGTEPITGLTCRLIEVKNSKINCFKWFGILRESDKMHIYLGFGDSDSHKTGTVNFS